LYKISRYNSSYGYEDNNDHLKSISKNILIESYTLQCCYKKCKSYLIHKGYIFTPKINVLVDNNSKLVKEEFIGSINENTTLTYLLDSSNFLNCKIDWKVFSKASISLYDFNCNSVYCKNNCNRKQYNCNKKISPDYTFFTKECGKKIYDLKSLPDDFSDILNESKECMWQIELNTLLDIDYIDYINTTKIFTFATGIVSFGNSGHERLGKESLLSLLDDDVLKLIVSKC
jgi:hypothetical protein